MDSAPQMKQEMSSDAAPPGTVQAGLQGMPAQPQQGQPTASGVPGQAQVGGAPVQMMQGQAPMQQGSGQAGSQPMMAGVPQGSLDLLLASSQRVAVVRSRLAGSRWRTF